MKATVSAALLFFLVRRVNRDELGTMLRQTDPAWVLLSVLVGLVPIAISSWKWRILLRAKGKPVPFGRLLNLYFTGLFVNNFFPSTIGGDIFRGYEVGRDVDDRALAMASVFMERFTGMTALMAIALVAFVSNLSSFRDPRFALALGAGLLVYIAVTVAVVFPGPLAWGQRLFPAGLPGRLIGKLIRVQSAIHDYAGQTRAILAALALSLLFHVTAMVYIYVSSRAFGVALPPRTLLVIVPVIMFISSLPITIGGLGLFEWAFFFTFGASGAGGSPGLLVGLLVRANSLLFSLWGGIVYAVKGIGKGAGGRPQP
ncbi:MAG: lysylphosphatidylglycerol synthase transmembrane domain-containing protein [Candidatus Methylomirabilia bacterium]